MPVGVPPKGGPLGRSRSRLSASGLTTYLRCPRQWYLTRKVGLSSPSSIGQITGLVIEDALCRVLMHRPGPMESLEALRSWAYDLCQEEAKNAWEEGEDAWNARLWKRDDSDWSTVEVSDYEAKVRNGIDLFLEEVEACYNQNGGPYLEIFRSGSIPFRIPSPAWGNEPHFPVPEKIRSLQARDWSVEHSFEWQSQEEKIQWNEAWEIARPWFKDPRSINHNACFIQKVGLLVNSISFFDGMGTYGSSISNLDTVVHPFQKVFNTNFDSMHGFGQEPTKREWCNRWKVGISRATSESSTRPQVILH